MEQNIELFLHHFGFVVRDVREGAEAFKATLGATWDGVVYSDPLQGVKVTFITTRAGDAAIELVEPDGPRSPVLRFLMQTGGGFHHVCYEVEDLDRQLTVFQSRGLPIISRPKPAVAFAGRRIAWVLTEENLLLELLEKHS